MVFPLLNSDQVRWRLTLLGQFLLVFGVVALSGPGRIDIVDGQTRYEVARSLVDHGDGTIRDPNVWFGVYPGRGGRLYTGYRLPQTLAAVPAILMADATGTISEARRHFFFSLVGALACGLLAITYTVWFRHLGLAPFAAVLWGLAGIFCTPSWFYGTTTFDEMLGTLILVAAVAVAHGTRKHQSLWGATLAGLLIGLAFNCKQPLGIFVLAVLAANYDPRIAFRRRLGRGMLVCAGLALGVVAFQAYEWYKFPNGTTSEHAALLTRYGPRWTSNPLPGLLSFLISPNAGVFWYCPTLVISLMGLAMWFRTERTLCQSVIAASTVFILFTCFLTFFKGDPAWGPRYLTPVFALFWVFAPFAVAWLHRRKAALLLGLGVVVQLLALSVDQHRLFIQHRVPSALFIHYPWLSFHTSVSHLPNRPREIIEILGSNSERCESFSPAPSPTFAFPVLNDRLSANGREAIQKYHVLNSLRPWWISQQYLTPEQRPIPLIPAAAVILSLTGLGAALILVTVNQIEIGAKHSNSADQTLSARQAILQNQREFDECQVH